MSRRLRSGIIAIALSIVIVVVFFAFTSRSVGEVIAENETGEQVVSMSSGIESLFLKFIPKGGQLKHQIEVIEYRDPQGKTLARYKVRWAPNDYAKVSWTDQFVAISSGLNGECPDFRVLRRGNGEENVNSSDEVNKLPLELRKSLNPCHY